MEAMDMDDIKAATAKGAKVNPRTGCVVETDDFKYTPDADGVQMDRSFMKKAQKVWGCADCFFRDIKKDVGDEGLCTFPGRPHDEDGNCIKFRRVKSYEEVHDT